MKPITILNRFFNDGSLTPKKNLMEFKKEIDELSSEDKQELIALAAVELGVEVES